MVVERQPPKESVSPRKAAAADREGFIAPPPARSLSSQAFGQTSQLQSPLRSNNIFNIPKSHQPRPEHHRTISSNRQVSTSSRVAEDGFRDPFVPRPIRPREQREVINISNDSSLVEIKPPAPPVAWSTYRPQPQMFSSVQPAQGAFSPVNQYQQPKPIDDGLFVVDDALFRDKFGDDALLEPVDSATANKEMKALLEGAFGDEDDKPKTRGQRRKVEKKVHDMAEKMKNLGAKGDAQKYHEEEEEEDEGEVDDGTREGLKVKLLPHQIDGVDWMVAKELGKTKVKGYVTKGGILADDMGLGKTIQAITLMLLNPRPKDGTTKMSKKVAKGTLVIAPLALIQQWNREIEDKVEDSHALRVLVHHGPKRAKRGEDLKKYDVVITTYQTVMSEHENSSDKADGPKVGCFGVHWYRIVLDEAHSIKNRNAKSTKACYALESEFRWCLSGTPMQNHLDELQSLIHFLKIRPIENRAVWKEQIITPMSNGKGGLAIRRLQVYLKAFMKRRTKDVLREHNGLGKGNQNSSGFKLVNRKVEKIVGEFTGKEREYYSALEQKADKSLERMMGDNKLSYASALTLLLRLRQACNHKELIKKSLSKDTDALTVKESSSSQTPRKAGSTQDIDDVANLLGGLSVDNKQCNVCLAELNDEEIASRMVRCTDCEADFVDDETSKPRKKKKKSKKKVHRSQPSPKETARKDRTRKIIDDSDEEEEGGDWVIPEKERSLPNLGKAGGTDDENADGRGEWVGSSDSETDDDSSMKMVSQKKKVLSLSNRDQSSEGEEESDGSGSYDSSEEEEEPFDSADSDTLGSTHVVASTKIRHLMKILHRESAKHKFIVYSQFTSMLDLIEPFLRKEGITYCRYDGRMPNHLREASLEKLRNDKYTRVLLCSLKCGSLGLNLTAASRVVILEPFWNPFVEEQAIDRVHRLNQTVDVTVYRLTIAGTVEERIFDLQEQKRTLAEAAIEGKAVAKLSMKDILNLFKYDAESNWRGEKGEEGIGLRSRVLKEPMSSQSTEGGGSQRESGGRRQGSGNANGSGGKERASGGGRNEHAVFGRRW
ncbi:hypothetical protein MMC10_011269 [Thelotrema lepadinum]|nr:hypothetical protein [Thelotrema lepadinum]